MSDDTSSPCGQLYIVSTPIGNLDDISLRALDTLRKVDAILAEDTRKTAMLLNHFQIQKKLIAFHAHNEHQKSADLIDALKKGQSFALVSDAGTPLIADPGFGLVNAARTAAISVFPIPGCSALLAALTVSGLPCDKFYFHGFLPAKSALRKTMLTQFKNREETIVVYESTHRIIACLQDIVSVFGPTYRFVLAKELTKLFETIKHDSAATILDWLLTDKARIKGEFVLIFGAKTVDQPLDEAQAVLEMLLKELSLKQAVKIGSLVTKVPKNTLYKIAIQFEQK